MSFDPGEQYVYSGKSLVSERLTKMNFQTQRPRCPIGTKNGSTDSLNTMTRRSSLDIGSSRSSSTDSLNTMTRKLSLDIGVGAPEKMTKMAVNFVTNNTVSSLTTTVVPDIYGTLVSMALCYVTQNYKIVKRKPHILFHPKKILRAMPLSVSGLLLDTVFTNGIDSIEDGTMHLAAHVVLKTLQISLTLL
ncbi:hypothetical protein PBCVOR070422_684L [Paramecium bursaria Chlorella virus OR0704.2.2]|nr:hypothetical protein PBCVOR070422_684L [Paramecium bursaria Chlorella virus OR0704.2.2]